MSVATIEVTPRLARVQVGSCNGCHRLDDPFVTLVKIGDKELRVCDPCRRRLVVLLQAEIEAAKRRETR